MAGVDKVPMQDEYKETLEGDMYPYKMIVKLVDLNDLSYKGLILFINNSSTVGKMVFGFIWNSKSLEFLYRKGKISWDWLINKYMLHTVLFLLTLGHEFHNIKLDSVKDDLIEWILKLEEPQI